MLKAEYSRKINKSSFILIPENDCREETDSIEMFRYHQIPYFLCMREQKKDTEQQFSYDITGKRSLEQLLEYKKLDYQLFKKIITSFDLACIQTENYMLTEDDILLKPEFVFTQSDTEQIVYCYLPGNKDDICSQFKEFMEYLLKFIDHNDERAVQLAYGVYQKVIEERASLHNVLSNTQQLTEQYSINMIQKQEQQYQINAAIDVNGPMNTDSCVSEKSSIRIKQPHMEADSKSIKQRPHMEADSRSVKQCPHMEADNKGIKQHSHNETDIRGIKQHLNTETDSESITQCPHMEADSRNDKQHPYMEADSRSIMQYPRIEADSEDIKQIYTRDHIRDVRQMHAKQNIELTMKLNMNQNMEDDEKPFRQPFKTKDREERFGSNGYFDEQYPESSLQDKVHENEDVYSKGTQKKSRQDKKEQQQSPEARVQKKEKLRKRAAEKLKKLLLKNIYTDRAGYMEEETVFEADTEEEPEIRNPTVCLMPEAESFQNRFVYQGADRTRDFYCTGTKMIVGSDKEESDIYIPIPMVSRVHARIEMDELGTFLEDMNSTNGTHVNGELLQYHERRMLQRGDIISLAGESYSFH